MFNARRLPAPLRLKNGVGCGIYAHQFIAELGFMRLLIQNLCLKAC